MRTFISIVPQRLALPLLAVSGLVVGATANAASYSETVLADQPTAYYRLEDPANSASITDSSASGAFGGTVYFDDLGSYPQYEQPGIGSNSFSFHLYTPEGGAAQRSHIEVPYAPELNPVGSFTAECWVRPTSWATDPNEWRSPVGNFGGWGSTPYQGWHIYQSPAVGGASTWIWVQKGGGIWMGGGNVTKNKWDYLVATYDGTTIKFYVNGVLRSTATDTAPAANTSQPLCFGGDPAGNWYFDGNVDEVAVYSNVLTQDQINTHYAVGLTNFYNGPVAAYIGTGPSPASAYAGRTVTFVVSADGTAPLSYQWYKGNTPIPGETTDTLSFTCAYVDNGATYKVAVTNLYGTATSDAAALTVMTNLTLTSGPASITRNVGSKAAFIAVADGALPVTYQWYKGGTAIPDGTNQTLWLNKLQLSDEGTKYYAKLTNPWAATNSEEATLSVTARAVDVPITGYAKIVMADDPVAFWRLDETDGVTTAVDAAGSFDGTYTPGNGTITYGATTGIPGETDKAASVTGGARVAIPWALELNPHGPFTAEAWFKPASLAANGDDYRTVYSSMGPGPGGSGPNGWLLYQQPNNTFAWVLFNQGWNSSFMGDPLDVVEANTWYHMALTFDGALFHIYVNGKHAAEQTFDLFIPNQDGAFNLGWRNDSDWKPFDGTLDDAAFYDKALTLEQVQAHYYATVRLSATQSGNSLVLSWPFGTLQQADQVTGTYTDVPAATSPYTAAISTTGSKFYRVLVQ